MAKGREVIDFHNQIARNQEFNLSILYTRGQSPKVVALQNVHMVVLFDQGNILSKEVWVRHAWKPKLRSRGRCFFFHKK
jgi:hypothetical protein